MAPPRCRATTWGCGSDSIRPVALQPAHAITLAGSNDASGSGKVPGIKRILIVNGPNLNMLGTREPEIYGHRTLNDIAAACEAKAAAVGLAVDFRQSNDEAEIIGWIQEAGTGDGVDGIVINPASFTHTSLAIADALRMQDCPVIELHLSNIFAREAFRHHSWVSPAATGMICGFGGDGYVLAVEAMANLLNAEKAE
jgi:3-dehydroquinate dehydratase-2